MNLPFTVVFDNYQQVPGNSRLHDVMREALGEIPKHGRVIFIVIPHAQVEIPDWADPSVA